MAQSMQPNTETLPSDFDSTVTSALSAKQLDAPTTTTTTTVFTNPDTEDFINDCNDTRPATGRDAEPFQCKPAIGLTDEQHYNIHSGFREAAFSAPIVLFLFFYRFFFVSLSFCLPLLA